MEQPNIGKVIKEVLAKQGRSIASPSESTESTHPNGASLTATRPAFLDCYIGGKPSTWSWCKKTVTAAR